MSLYTHKLILIPFKQKIKT